MPNCDNCGAFVTPDFHRVFADNEGTLHGCHECTPNAGSKHPDKVEAPKS